MNDPRTPALRRRLGLCLALTVALSATACVSSHTGRRQLLLIPAKQEIALGAEAFTEMSAQEKRCEHAPTRKVIETLGRRIADVSPKPKWDWRFELFDAPDTLNAWALPGGKVGVYTGLLGPAQTEAGLAAVMGHEVAHAILRHGAERMSQELVVQMGVDAAGIAFDNSEYKKVIMGSLGVGAQLGVALPFSRKMETEADIVGLKYMAQAGYDPREAVAFWQRFKAATGPSGTPELLSTHPATDKRIAALSKALPEAIAIYEASAKRGKGAALSVPSCGGGRSSPAPAPAAAATAPAAAAPAPTAAPAPARKPARRASAPPAADEKTEAPKRASRRRR